MHPRGLGKSALVVVYSHCILFHTYQGSFQLSRLCSLCNIELASQFIFIVVYCDSERILVFSALFNGGYLLFIFIISILLRDVTFSADAFVG